MILNSISKTQILCNILKHILWGTALQGGFAQALSKVKLQGFSEQTLTISMEGNFPAKFREFKIILSREAIHML